MKNFLINGLKAKTGGGKSILNDYLTELSRNITGDRFYILVPDVLEYQKYAAETIVIVDVPSYAKKNLLFPFLYYREYPRLIARLEIDAIFNFGDVIIPTNVPQLFFFDWPYAVYPDSSVWQQMNLKEKLVRSMKVQMMKRSAGRPRIVIAQTKTIEKRLKRFFKLDNVVVIPNAVSAVIQNNNDRRLSVESMDFLCLSYYYVHKNLEILIDVGRRIRDAKSPMRIILTIEAEQGEGARKMLERIETENLQDVVVNIGPVPYSELNVLYQKHRFFVMPSILETYGLTYVEAMANQLTLVVADMDFAHDVCQDAAYYFSPFDGQSVFDSMQHALNNEEGRAAKIRRGNEIVAGLPDWNTNFAQYHELLYSLTQ